MAASKFSKVTGANFLQDKSQLRAGKMQLPVLENEFNERVRAVVEKSKDRRGRGVASIVSEVSSGRLPSLHLERTLLTYVAAGVCCKRRRRPRHADVGIG